jgi:hypothetical protein
MTQGADAYHADLGVISGIDLEEGELDVSFEE